jgi:hypothetical protein
MKQIYWIRSLILLFLISGCASPVSTASSISSTQTSISKTGISATAPTLTLSKATASALGTMVSPEDAKTLVVDLLHDNGGCQLPCLWGLIPGKMDNQTFAKFTSQFGDLMTPDIYVSSRDFNDTGGFTLIYRQNNVHTDVVFGYSKDKVGKVEMLALSGYAMHEQGKDLDWKSSDLSPVYGDASFNQTFAYYLLPQILTNYGRPSQVLLRPFLVDPQRPDIQWQPFSLVLFYPERGIFVEYVSPRETVGSKYIGCPSKTSINMVLWNPKNSLSLKDVVKKAGAKINEFNMVNYQPVEKATLMTLEEFYQVFKKPGNTECLETPQSLWNH